MDWRWTETERVALWIDANKPPLVHQRAAHMDVPHVVATKRMKAEDNRTKGDCACALGWHVEEHLADVGATLADVRIVSFAIILWLAFLVGVQMRDREQCSEGC
tara:strand:- start:162 stop:473 length:312 start_codon:yes stop_codon:yes gene_type:complete